MANENIRVTTSADLSGLQAVERQMKIIRDMAKEMSGMQLFPTSGGDNGVNSTVSQNVKEMHHQAMQAQQEANNSILGNRYIMPQQQVVNGAPPPPETGNNSNRPNPMNGLNSVQETIDYFTQKWPEAAPTVVPEIVATIQGMTANQALGIVNNGAQKFVAKPGTFNIGTEKKMTMSMGSQERADFWVNEARDMMMAGKLHSSDEQITEFIKASGSSPEARQALYQKYAAEANLTPISGGSSGANGKKSPWSADAMGSAAGEIIQKMLPISGPVALGMAGIGLAGSSFNSYMSSGEQLSGLTKQITSAGDSLEKFQDMALKAGASFGYSADQVATVANTLGTAFGHIGTAGLTNLSQGVMGFSRAFGLPVNAMASGMGSAANVGIVAGGAAGMTPTGFMAQIANSTFNGMQGRTGEVLDEILSVVQGIQSSSVVAPNLLGIIGMVDQMNKSGVRQLQGQSGANLIGSFAQGLQSPGLGPAGWEAEYRAFGQGGYWQTLYASQMGPTYQLPTGPNKGKTTGQAMIDYYQGLFGKAKVGSASQGFVPQNQATWNEEGLLSQQLNITMPQAGALLSIYGGGINQAQNAQQDMMKKLGLSSLPTDMSKMGVLAQLYGASKEKTTALGQQDINDVMKQFQQYGGTLSDQQQKELDTAKKKGDIGTQQKILGQAIQNDNNWAPMTKVEGLDGVAADVHRIAIKLGAVEAKGATGLTGKGTNETLNVPTYQSDNQRKAEREKSLEIVKKLFEDIGKGASDFWGFLHKNPDYMSSSYTNSGGVSGYSYNANGQSSGGFSLASYNSSNGMSFTGLPWPYNVTGKANSSSNSGNGVTTAGYVTGSASSYNSIFAAAAKDYNLPVNLLEAVAKNESSFNPNAVSSAGAVGLMQLMPDTAAGLGVTNPYDPTQNIMGGAKYISQLLQRYGGDVRQALAAYNAGPGNVPGNGTIPSYTQGYVNSVMNDYGGRAEITGTVTLSSQSIQQLAVAINGNQSNNYNPYAGMSTT